MNAYNDALLALGRYVYAAAAFIRCDHPSAAICAEVNERLTGLVDAVDSAALAMELENESDE